MPRLRSQFMNDNSKHAYPVDAQRSTYRWARLGRWSRQAGAVLGVFYVIGILIIWPEPVRAAVPPQEAMLSFLLRMSRRSFRFKSAVVDLLFILRLLPSCIVSRSRRQCASAKRITGPE